MPVIWDTPRPFFIFGRRLWVPNSPTFTWKVKIRDELLIVFGPVRIKALMDLIIQVHVAVSARIALRTRSCTIMTTMIILPMMRWMLPWILAPRILSTLAMARRMVASISLPIIPKNGVAIAWPFVKVVFWKMWHRLGVCGGYGRLHNGGSTQAILQSSWRRSKVHDQ